MKKVLSLVAIAAFTLFAASCGDNAAEKARQDSMRQDSINKANQRVTDSVNAAKAKDSADKAAADMAAKQHMMDSLRQDSIDKASKGKKPMTPQQKQHQENKKATGGRG